jgi:hypothetical protein
MSLALQCSAKRRHDHPAMIQEIGEARIMMPLSATTLADSKILLLTGVSVQVKRTLTTGHDKGDKRQPAFD